MAKKISSKNEDEKMEIFDSRYYLLSKTILYWSGLWPYQSTLKSTLKATFFLTICGMAVIPQVRFNYQKLTTPLFGLRVKKNLHMKFC